MIRFAGWLIDLFLLAVLLPLTLPFWLMCRFKAKRCPNCDSKWRTELVGEWDGEDDWHCHKCGQFWSTK